MVTKFLDHFLWIARAINQIGPNGMWDEEDGFYYDILRFPDGGATRLKVRSMVGLLPLCATTIVEPWQRERVPTQRQSTVSGFDICRHCSRASIPLGQATTASRIEESLHWSTRKDCAGSFHECSMRMSFSARTGSAHFLATTPSTPIVVTVQGHETTGELCSSRIGFRLVRGQLKLARSCVDAGERAVDPRFAVVLPLLRQQL